ncbi:hypothetical protein D3C87_1759920 [compost metagenome]
MWAMAAEMDGGEMWIWADAAAMLPCLAVATRYSIWRREMRLSMVQLEGTGNVAEYPVCPWRWARFSSVGCSAHCSVLSRADGVVGSPGRYPAHKSPGTPKLGASRGSRARVT